MMHIRCLYTGLFSFRPIGGVEAGDVHVAPQLPGVAEVASQFGIAAILLKLHVVTVSVGTVVRPGHHAAETLLFTRLRLPSAGYCRNRILSAHWFSPRPPASCG